MIHNFKLFQSYVTCSLGIWTVGLVTLPYGFVNAFVSFFGGNAVAVVGRTPVFVAGKLKRRD